MFTSFLSSVVSVILVLGEFSPTSQHNTSIANISLQWRHNGHDSVSNHQPHDCLLSRLFRRRSKKTPKLRVTGLCAGNSPGNGEFPAQTTSDAENGSIWWRHHVGSVSQGTNIRNPWYHRLKYSSGCPKNQSRRTCRWSLWWIHRSLVDYHQKESVMWSFDVFCQSQVIEQTMELPVVWHAMVLI